MWVFLMDVLQSIKKINRLLSKEMSLTFLKLIFQALKMCHHVSYGELQLMKYHLILKLLVAT